MFNDSLAAEFRALREENERLRDLIRSVNLTAKPRGRSLDELGKDMHLIYDVTKQAAR